MVHGWTRVCPECRNSDGAKVNRIALHPTFQCECGYVWDGSRAKFVGPWSVPPSATTDERRSLAELIVKAVIAVRRRDHNTD